MGRIFFQLRLYMYSPQSPRPSEQLSLASPCLVCRMHQRATQPLSKRRRVVTSCSECYRRKQKCDRKCPCNNCVARNVPNSCHYDTLSTSNHEAQYTDRPDASTANPFNNQDRPNTMLPASEASADLGYSSIDNSNSFMELTRALQDNGEIYTIAATCTRPSQSTLQGRKARGLLTKLPPINVIERLVDIFFNDVNWHYFILERTFFDDLLLHWTKRKSAQSSLKYLKPQELTRELHYFPTLLFQVLALTLQFWEPDTFIQDQLLSGELSTSQEYSDQGEELLTILGRQNRTLTAVQADHLRSLWLKSLGKGAEAWHSLGNSIRQGQELGLHRHRDVTQSGPDSIPETLSILWYEEYKRRAWMNLFVWDSFMAMILGRPRMINADDCDVKPPIDCNIPITPSETIPGTVQPGKSSSAPTTVSACLLKDALAHKVHKMRALKVDRPYPKDYSVIQDLHEQANSLLDNAPPYLRSENPNTRWDREFPYLRLQREEAWQLVNSFLMTLHRPHVITHAESRKAALKAALATLESQQRLFGQTSERHYPLFSLAFYTIDASILLCVILRTCPPESHQTKQLIKLMLEQSIDRLSQVQAVNLVARSGLRVVQRCYQRIYGSSENRNIPFITASMSKSPVPVMQDTTTELIPHFTAGSEESLLSLDALNSKEPIQTSLTLDSYAMPHTFDETYWLQQLDQFQTAPIRLSDPGASWDPIDFDF